VWIDERYRMILSLVHDFHGYVPMTPVKVSLMKGILGKKQLKYCGSCFFFLFSMQFNGICILCLYLRLLKGVELA